MNDPALPATAAAAAPPAPILIVDDHAPNLMALEALLVPLAQPVVRAASGEEALRYLLDGDCAVVLMDLAMPGMDGIETAALIRARERTARIPIIFVTANSPSASIVSAAYAQGAVDFIVKPIDPSILLSKVAVFVELYVSRERVRRLAAERAHDLVRAVVAGMSSGVIAQDPAGRLVYANDAAARIGGFASARELLEAPPGEVLARVELENEAGAPLPPLLLPGTVVASGRTATRATVKIRNHETREERWYEIAAQPVTAIDDGTRLAVSSFHDVTDARFSRERERFLSEATRLLASSLDYERTLRTITTLAVPWLADWCAVEMRKSDGTHEQLAVAHVDPAKVELAWELRRRYPPDPEAPTGVPQVLRSGQSELYAEIPDELLVQSTVDAEHLRITRELGLRSAILVPIVTSRGTAGAITLVSAESRRRYGAEDLALAEQLGARAGLAVENAQLYAETQAAVRARDEFLSIAAHELRTPLTSIQLNVGVLARRFEDAQPTVELVDKSKKRVADIGTQLTALNRLIDQLLDVSRVGARALEVRREPTDAVVLTRAVLDELQPQAQHAGCALHLTAPRALEGEWDATRLREIVANLVANALKYGRGAPIDVTLEEHEGAMVMAVRDHGMGISPADQARIFERFERAVPARHYGGLGLGLWIVRQIVVAHAGEIWVTSRPNEGATFFVRLPLRASA